MLFTSEDETVVQALTRAQTFYQETAEKCEKDSVACRAFVVNLGATIALLGGQQAATTATADTTNGETEAA